MTTHTFHSASTPMRHAWFAWLLFTIIWFVSIGHNALIHPDEGRYATIALNMLHSGDWVTPRLNGILYFEKPALPYWLGALSFKLFGVSEWSARLWPALSGWLAVITVALTARCLWDSEAGHLAGMVMGSSCWVMANSHFLNLDTGLTFFLTLSLCAFLLAQREDAGHAERRSWMWMCWAAMAGATLSKGLIGIVIPGATLVLYSLLFRRYDFWRQLDCWIGLLIYLVLTAPWFILVSLRNPSFAHFFFIYEHFDRFLLPDHRRNGPFWYFVPYLLVGFLPWVSLLPAMLRQGMQREGRAPLQIDRLLLVWAAFIFLFFSKSDSKLPSYILPMFPALALLAAHVMTQARPSSLIKHLILPCLVWLGLLALYFFTDRFVSPDLPVTVAHHMAANIALGALAFLLGAACAWRFLSLERKSTGIIALSLGSLVALTMVATGYDAYGQMKSSQQLVKRLPMTPDTEVFSVQYYDQTLPFYLQRNVTLVDYRDEFSQGEKIEPQRWLPTIPAFMARWHQAPHALAMMTEGTYQALKRAGLPMTIVYQDSRRMVVAKP